MKRYLRRYTQPKKGSFRFTAEKVGKRMMLAQIIQLVQGIGGISKSAGTKLVTR